MKQPKGPAFLSLLDEHGLPYLSASVQAIKGLRFKRNLLPGSENLCTFLDDKIRISKKASSVFSSELTGADDVIIAVLSLLLILAIESILATVLLHTHHGSITNFGFSVRHFLELVRDFRFGALVSRHVKKSPEKPPRRLNKRVILLAMFLLVLTFGLEVLVLVLSSPHVRDVTTRTATFQLVQAVEPQWSSVQKHAGSTLDRPCRAVTFEGVDGGDTTMVPCLTSNATGLKSEAFRAFADPVEVEIVSDTHQFGIEHSVSIGNLSATYSARVYFSPADRGSSMLSYRERFFDRSAQLAFVHRQFVAYLFNEYRNKASDNSKGIDELNDIKFKFNVEAGPVIDVIRLNDGGSRRERQVVSVRHVTRFNGVIPRGVPALQFAAVVFRASVAIEVAGPDLTALKRSNGNTIEKERLIWQEEARTLNWLSLSILLCSSLSILTVLRYILKPVGTAEIARIVVKSALE